MTKYTKIGFFIIVGYFVLTTSECKKVTDPDPDKDNDGIEDIIDNCIDIHNPDQIDTDGDGIPNNEDSCPNDYNKGNDYDNDRIDDACDPPPPAYELTFGLYDDFDGMGCEQTYDGSQMAIAGSLSGQLWAYAVNEDVSVVELSTIVDDSIIKS